MTTTPASIKAFLKDVGLKSDSKIPEKSIGILFDTVNDCGFMVINGKISSAMRGAFPLVSQEVLEEEMEKAARETYFNLRNRLQERSKEFK